MKEQLQKLRKSKGLTQEQAAVDFDVSLSSYQKYERDAIAPSYETLVKIADFYGVTTDYLLGREPKQPESPIDEFADKVRLEELEKILIQRYLELTDIQRECVLDFIRNAIKEEQEK